DARPCARPDRLAVALVRRRSHLRFRVPACRSPRRARDASAPCLGLQSRGKRAPAFKRGMNGPLELPALPGLPIRCPSGILERMDEQTERTSTVQTTVRQTVKYQLKPTPQHTGVLEQTLVVCRTLYTGALEQRRTWGGRGQGRAATHAQQEAEVPALKAAFPEDATVHSQVLPDALARLDPTVQTFFRRGPGGGGPGGPRRPGGGAA